MTPIVYKKTVVKAYEGMKDELVVEIANSGDSFALDYLMNKYKSLVRFKSHPYFLMGGDKEDVIQEGMIGLYKAIRDYNVDRLASFRGFADICITRQMITAIKGANRQKHTPLNSYISLSKPLYYEESDRTLLDVIEGESITDPADLVLSQEQVKSIEIKVKDTLSGLELKVLALYIEGRSYREIAEILNRHVKSIDNALQRIKRKLVISLKI